MLQDQAGGLQSSVNVLEGRLDPVLTEPSEPPPPAVEAKPESGRLYHNLVEIHDSLLRTRTQVDGIVERLEL